MTLTVALVTKIVMIGLIANVGTAILKWIFVGPSFSMSNNIVSCMLLYAGLYYMKAYGSNITIGPELISLDGFQKEVFLVLFLLIAGVGMYFRDLGRDF